MTATSESRIRQKFTGESDEKEPAVRADSRSSQHELDRAPAPDATPHRFATSRAQTRRDQASQSHPGRTHSYKKANQKKKKGCFSAAERQWGEGKGRTRYPAVAAARA